MVHLTRIYTRTGDHGHTRLVDNSLVAKTDLRLAAYADVDEANCAIGVAIALGALPAEVAEVLRVVQNDLFDVGADLGTPVVAQPAHPALRATAAQVERLEGWCDRFNEPLAPLRSFVLPGGRPGSALLHTARAVVRRAERSGWAAYEQHGPAMNERAITYLNRLSDLLFILARAVAGPDGDVLWVPGEHTAAD